MDSDSILVSIVVCTYDRPADLARLLDSLTPQLASRNDCELIVVENGPNAETQSIAEQAGARYIREDQPGLSRARNRGWRAARGGDVAFIDDDAVAFIDDDAVARPDWLANICATLLSDEPDVLGGPYYPFFLTEPPAWFPHECGAWTLGDEPRAMTPREHACGGNFVMRRALLDELGGFRSDLGMIAGAQGYGEETELQDRLRSRDADARILYRPDVAIDHLVRSEKMTLRWWWRRAVRQGLQAGGIYDAREFGGLARSAVYAVGHAAWAVGCVLLCPLRSRRQWPFWRTYFLQRVFPHLQSSLAYCSFLWRCTFARRAGA